MGPLEPALAGEIGGFISDPFGTVKLRPYVGIPTTILSLATPEKVPNKVCSRPQKTSRVGKYLLLYVVKLINEYILGWNS